MKTLPGISASDLHDLALLYMDYETAFKVLVARAPQDPEILAAIGRLYNQFEKANQ